MSIWIFPTALLIGLVLGLFGAGGGLMTVPALMVVGEMPVKQAVPMSLWIVTLVSVAALIHQRAWRQLQLRLLMVLGSTGVLGSAAGARLGAIVPDHIQLGILTVLIFFVVFWITVVRLENKVQLFRYIPAVATGLGIGLLTGLLGIGGGFLLVPALLFLGVCHFPTAVAHSLVLVAFNAFSGAIVYLLIDRVEVDLLPTLAIALIAAIGSVIGGMLLKRLPAARLQKGFAIVLLLLGGFVGWQSLMLL